MRGRRGDFFSHRRPRAGSITQTWRDGESDGRTSTRTSELASAATGQPRPANLRLTSDDSLMAVSLPPWQQSKHSLERFKPPRRFFPPPQPPNRSHMGSTPGHKTCLSLKRERKKKKHGFIYGPFHISNNYWHATVEHAIFWMGEPVTIDWCEKLRHLVEAWLVYFLQIKINW